MPTLRTWFVWHRWLGIAGGLMLFVWYASGVGLHWRVLASILSPPEIQRTLGKPFAPAGAGKSFADILSGLPTPPREVRLRRAGSRLVYDVRMPDGDVDILDAHTGQSVLPISESFARDIAQNLLPGTSIATSELMTEPDHYYRNVEEPAYRITFSDFSNTLAYVNAATAAIPARARLRERVYTLLASKPHYLTYDLPFIGRDPDVSDSLLVMLNAIGLLVVATGVFLGVWKLARTGFPTGAVKGHLFARRWHYLLGLAFSVTTLGFVISGFFLVFRDSTVPQITIAPLRDEVSRVLQPLDPARVTPLPLASLDLGGTPAGGGGLLMVTLKQVLDVPVYIFQDAQGRQFSRRADTGQSLAIDDRWLTRVASALLERTTTVADVRRLSEYDDYYYARNNRIPSLPVIRLAADDEDKTLVYVSAISGEVTGRANREFRVRRWLVTGLHTWDFPFLVRRPLLWDIVSVTLLGGGLWVTVSGLYLGWLAIVATVRKRRRETVEYQRRAS